jgi:hypothetical protein
VTSARETRDEQLKKEIMRVWDNRKIGRRVYGARKVWRRLQREDIEFEGPWRGISDVSLATLEWVAWYNGEAALVLRLHVTERIRGKLLRSAELAGSINESRQSKPSNFVGAIQCA